jgi:cytochrome oxidase Cu insertion factor (SCO1/SenC/PrrC family)
MRTFAAACALTLAMTAAGLTAPVRALGADNPFDHIVPLVKLADRLPSTRFVDQHGRALTLDALRGRAVAIAFVYTRCRDACPIITHKFALVRALLGDGPFGLVEVTIDPAHDSAAVMAAYARDNRMDAPEWLALTGSPADVDDFNRRMGVQAIATGRNEIVHNERVVLASPDGVVADIIDGSSWTPADLAAELRHVSGMHASLLDRFDLALGAAVAFCGGALSGRAGIADFVASIAVIGAAIALFVWLVRRTPAARA